jgi:general secretion pathway protein G
VNRLGGSAAGMTYLELLMVVALVGVLTAVVLPTGITLRRASQERQLRRSLDIIRTAIDRYHCDWIRGCIESEDEAGWPRDLEELTEGIEFAHEKPECQLPCGTTIEPEDASSPLPPIPSDEPPPLHVYLRHLPPDPFNKDDDERDTLGWRARAYDDEPDDTAWGGDDVYDVYTGSEALALDGTELATW